VVELRVDIDIDDMRGFIKVHNANSRRAERDCRIADLMREAISDYEVTGRGLMAAETLPVPLSCAVCLYVVDGVAEDAITLIDGWAVCDTHLTENPAGLVAYERKRVLDARDS